MVTGRTLLGEAPSGGPLRAWYWNGEDSRVEIERRIAAICKHHDIDAEVELGGLFYDSGHDMPIKIAAAGRGGPGSVIINEETIKQVTAAIVGNQIDVAVFRPRSSACTAWPKATNVAIDQVVKVFGRIADQTRCSIELDHHTRKPSPGQIEITVDDARGGGAIVYAVRSCRVINRMSPKRRTTSGSHRPIASRIPHRQAQGQLCTTRGGNVVQGRPGCYRQWRHRRHTRAVGLPERFRRRHPAADMNWVRALVAGGGEYRANSQAKNWIGVPIAERLKLDLDDKRDKAKVRRILKTWFKNGVLAVDERKDEGRKPRNFVVLGTWKPDDVAGTDDEDVDP